MNVLFRHVISIFLSFLIKLCGHESHDFLSFLLLRIEKGWDGESGKWIKKYGVFPQFRNFYSNECSLTCFIFSSVEFPCFFELFEKSYNGLWFVMFAEKIYSLDFVFPKRLTCVTSRCPLIKFSIPQHCAFLCCAQFVLDSESRNRTSFYLCFNFFSLFLVKKIWRFKL